jgi:hypothetical protein
MIFIFLLCLISSFLGAIWGRHLAIQGVTAANSLEKHQRIVYIILMAIAALVASLMIVGALKLTRWIPLIILLYIGEYTNHLMLGLGCFSLGLLVALELPGRHNRQRLSQMAIAVLAMSLPLVVLLYYLLPVTSILGTPLVVQGVVMQTTSITCSAASIATLGRLIGSYPNLSEGDVVEITGTNRFGTSTLAEIRAMQKLGMSPRFEQDLQVADLIKVGKPAVLHVMEPTSGTRIAHAIALFAVNLKQRTLTVGNPLFGRQVKTFEQMADYWLGEAIFVNVDQRSLHLNEYLSL